MTAVLLSLLAWELAAVFANEIVPANEVVPKDEIVDRFEELSYTYTDGEYQGEVFKYRLLKPAKIEEGKAYPAILFLHGAGERGTDNRLQLLYLPEQLSRPESREMYPCFLIVPQCRPDKRWVDVNWEDAISTKAAEPTDQMHVAISILQHVLQAYPVDRRRVYLTGLSMGGYGVWDLALRHPNWFAAVAPICGGGDETLADRLAEVPVWAWHGDTDATVPVIRSQRMIEAIQKAGGKPKYTELKGVGHNSWTPAYTNPDLISWMFQQVNDRLEKEPP